MIGSSVIRWIRNCISAIPEKSKDSNLKKSRVAAFIREHSIVLSLILSFAIIAIGSIVVASSFDKTISNRISIDTSVENRSIPVNFIWIDIEYKEPFSCREHLTIKKVTMNYNPDVLKDVDLMLYINSRFFDFFNLNPKNGIMTWFGATASWDENETWIENDRTIIFNQYNEVPIKSQVDLYDKIDYSLEYIDLENRSFVVSGRADLEQPVKCMDYVTETNVNISKLVLRLTGALIILGAFPFVAALKQVLEKKERKRGRINIHSFRRRRL